MLATFRQNRFVSEYLVDLNATRAAIRAGYSEHTADVQASRLLRNVQVKAAIAQKQQQTEERLQIQRDDVIQGLLETAKHAKKNEDPLTMIKAYREIGLLLGYYSPSLEQPQDNQKLSQAEIRELPESKLLEIANSNDYQKIIETELDKWPISSDS